jgi:hypothetical protein
MMRQWSQDELAEHWTLLPDELKLLANKAGATRLGFSLLLKAFAYQGRFPRHMQELPATVVVHVARQVGVPPSYIPATSGRVARSSITASRSGSSSASARRPFEMGTNSSPGWSLRELLRTRLEAMFPRPALIRLWQTSRGNPSR